jgi:hypothetical protein
LQSLRLLSVNALIEYFISACQIGSNGIIVPDVNDGEAITRVEDYSRDISHQGWHRTLPLRAVFTYRQVQL